MSTLSTIYGLFPDPDSAERGMNALRNAGVNRDRIIVMSDEPFEEYSFGHAEPSVAMPWLAVLGGVVGGTGGYLLARLTQTAYPIVTGGMPIVSPFPTAIVTYELTMLGAVLATIVTLLFTAKIPKWKQPLYDPEVSKGKILIAVVEPADEVRADLETKLRTAGADEIKSTGRFAV
jgi:Protein of unknown function (DUF3341)